MWSSTKYPILTYISHWTFLILTEINVEWAWARSYKISSSSASSSSTIFHLSQSSYGCITDASWTGGRMTELNVSFTSNMEVMVCLWAK